MAEHAQDVQIIILIKHMSSWGGNFQLITENNQFQNAFSYVRPVELMEQQFREAKMGLWLQKDTQRNLNARQLVQTCSSMLTLRQVVRRVLHSMPGFCIVYDIFQFMNGCVYQVILAWNGLQVDICMCISMYMIFIYIYLYIRIYIYLYMHW